MTEYVIMSYSQSMGGNITFEGRVEAENAEKAVRKNLNNGGRTFDIEEGKGRKGYYAVAASNMNTFRFK